MDALTNDALHMSIGSIVQSYVEGFEDTSELFKPDDEETAALIDWEDVDPGSEEIGEGTYCIVHKVTLRGDPTPYALKFLNKEWRDINVERYQQGAKDVALEGKLLERLRHPNIISLRGSRTGFLSASVDDENDPYFLLLEYLPETLENVLEQKRKTSVITKRSMRNKNKLYERIDHCALGVAKAFEYLHDNDIIFRDLKPSNIGFDESGTVKLFDFGNARELAYSAKTGERLGFAGTPRYMAPEIGTGQEYGLPSDVYSFGILLWEICALAIPFEDIQSMEDFRMAVFLDHKRPDLSLVKSGDLRNLITKCWDPTPSARPTFVQVRQELEQFLAQFKPRQCIKSRLPSSFPSKSSRRSRSNRNAAQESRKRFSFGIFAPSTEVDASGADDEETLEARLDSARAA